jgi:hypothetical protein
VPPETLTLASARQALSDARKRAFRDEKPAQWRYGGTGWLARLLYGVPHRYRQGKSEERIWLLSTFLAAQLFLGAIVGVILLTTNPLRLDSFAFGDIPPRRQLVLMILIAILLGVFLIAVAETRRRRSRTQKAVPSWARLRPAAFHFLLILGGLLVSAGIKLVPEFTVDAAGLYILGTAYAFVFFTHWRALAYQTSAMLLYALVLRHHDAAAPVTRVLLLWVVSAMVGACFSIVVGREYLYRGYFGGKAQLSRDFRGSEEPDE